MTTLEEFQFELDGYLFGNDCPIFVDEQGFDPGDPEWIDQDQTNPIDGSTVMGRDVRGASVWTFSLHVNGEESTDALVELGKMGAKWANGATGWGDPRAVSMLRYCLGGRTRVVFGRPRRFSAKPDNRIMGGYLPPMATFQRSDSLHYDDVEQQATMFMKPAETGGATFDATFPLVFEREPDFIPASAILVGGDARTWPVVTFTGPVTNPSVTIGDVTIGVAGTIAEFGSMTIDTRPWARTVKRVGNTTGAVLTRTTRMARSALKPGNYSAVFRGVDPSGAARCQVRWRDAWHTL